MRKLNHRIAALEYENQIELLNTALLQIHSWLPPHLQKLITVRDSGAGDGSLIYVFAPMTLQEKLETLDTCLAHIDEFPLSEKAYVIAKFQEAKSRLHHESD